MMTSMNIAMLLAILASANAQASYSTPPKSCCSLDAGFNISGAALAARQLSANSWEYGTAAEALLELYNPELSVFSPSAFPNGKLPIPNIEEIPSLSYAKPYIRLDSPTLIAANGSAGDPASLGVSALLIGQTDPAYTAAAKRQYDFLNNTVPRWPNGAISHREDYPELWADFQFMAPPFMSYYAVAENETAYIRAAVGQALLYRQVMKPNGSTGTWQHIIGPRNQDLGRSSTGNGWAAMGMARILATLLNWPVTGKESNAQIAQADLYNWIGEILQGALRSERDENGLLRNYLSDKGRAWFGETSGTALLTAVVYRAAVLQEEGREVFEKGVKDIEGAVARRPVNAEILNWADANREAIAKHVDESGIASPAVNPYDWDSRVPYTKGSPEGESFLVMLYAAWRDCVEAGACRK